MHSRERFINTNQALKFPSNDLSTSYKIVGALLPFQAYEHGYTSI